MGRIFPAGDDDQFVHPIVSLSLLIACMASVFSIISSVCLSRKKSTPQQKTVELDVDPSPDEAEAAKTDANAETTGDPPEVGDEEKPRPLPPPPGKGLKASASYHHRSTSSASSRGNLMSSMSVRVKQQYSKMEETLEHIDKKLLKHDKKLKHEDSIWKKTIILGEKCKVPDYEDDDTIICDDKGNRISAYHPKTPSSLPSHIDQDAIPRPSSASVTEKIVK